MRNSIVLAVSFVCLGVSLAFAGSSSIESSNGGSLQYGYGGFELSTGTSNTSTITVPAGNVVVHAVNFPACPTNTYVTIFDSTDTANLNAVATIYNIANSTGISSGSRVAGIAPAGDIQIHRQLRWKLSGDATLDSTHYEQKVTVLYHRRDYLTGKK